MLTQQKAIKIIKAEFPYLKDKFGVKKIALFGSFAKRIETKKSDVDILVEFEKPIGLKFVDLAEYLEKILGRKTDILTLEGIRGIRIKGIAQSIKRNLLYV
jgi:uncharacterized protein